MKIWKKQFGFMAVVAGLAAAVGASSGAQNAVPERPVSSASPVPVLVELFTSEGCSSCPPADTLLQELVVKQPVSGVRVIALSEHVDYWDRLGWKDPFSSSLFSIRQNDYAKAFRNPQVYTPQMVVDGQAEFLGSDRRGAQIAIRRAARRLKAKILIAQERSQITVQVNEIPRGTGAADIFAAVTENHLSSGVSAGENAGRRLTHTAVARELVRIGTLLPGKTFTGAFQPKAIGSRRNQNILIFIQEQKTRRVVGVEEVPFAGIEP